MVNEYMYAPTIPKGPRAGWTNEDANVSNLSVYAKIHFKEKVQYTYSCCFCQTFNLASIELLASIFEAEMFDLLHLNL
jgi:hypothetical protein